MRIIKIHPGCCVCLLCQKEEEESFSIFVIQFLIQYTITQSYPDTGRRKQRWGGQTEESTYCLLYDYQIFLHRCAAPQNQSLPSLIQSSFVCFVAWSADLFLILHAILKLIFSPIDLIRSSIKHNVSLCTFPVLCKFTLSTVMVLYITLSSNMSFLSYRLILYGPKYCWPCPLSLKLAYSQASFQRH